MMRSPSIDAGSDSLNSSPGFTSPWEQRATLPVPFITGSNPGLSRAEVDALPTFWAMQNSGGASSADDHWQHIDYNSDRRPSVTRTAPPTARLKDAISSPADPFAGSASAQPSPGSYSTGGGRHPSYYDPDSALVPAVPPMSRPHPHPRSASAPAVDALPVAALPGTMSSRHASQAPRSHRRGGPYPSRGGDAKQQRLSPPLPPSKTAGSSLSFGQRCKGALKGLFKREPVDDSMFEHIEDRHWTDDGAEEGRRW